VEAYVIDESKKINVRVNVRLKKVAELFSNGSFKEPLLNTTFNNGSLPRTVVKGCV
jgi:hypothetical protein